MSENGLIKGTLVLEGGSARGVFTAGVLDYLMEQGLYFENVIGVSAGACNATGYVGRQIGRAKQCMIHEDGSFRYLNLRGFVKTKSLMDMDMIFDTFPNELILFDYDAYFTAEINNYIGVTNCITGKVEYLTEKEDKQRLMKACRASSSLPLLTPIVNVDGIPYMDGGLAEPVPVNKGLELGEKVFVVMTNNPGYRKKPLKKGLVKIYAKSYKKYPEFTKTLRRRYRHYNMTMEYIETLEKEEKVFALRPQIPVVANMESDPEVLTTFYEHGYHLMASQYDNLQKYLTREE